jgi:hypothetical protein
MSELEKVKLLIGLVDDDENSLITLLLELADEILRKLSRTPEDYGHLKIDAVVVAYNQRGAEGNKETRSGGFSQTWSYNTMYDFIKAKLPARYVIK